MKNVLSTLVLLLVVGLLGWWVYSQYLSPGPQPLTGDRFLAPEKQFDLWKSEHLAFEIEQRLGKPLLSAWVNRNPEEIRSWFRSDFQAETLSGEADAIRKPPILQSTRNRESHSPTPVDNEQFLSDLFAPLIDLEIAHQDFRLLKLTETSPGVWECRIQLSATGADPDQQLHQVVTEHLVTLATLRPQRLGEEPCLIAWKFQSEKILSSDDPLMADITSALNLDDLQVRDNWTMRYVNPGNPKMRKFNFQIAIEDFDLDHDLDISLMAYNGTRFLLVNRDGKFEDATTEFGLARNSGVRSIFATAWIDFNNDGYPDLLSGPFVYKNEHGKGFTRIQDRMGLWFDADPMGYSVVDYNRDGLLDVYMLYPHIFDKPVHDSKDQLNVLPNRLYRNNGDGTFTDVTEITATSAGNTQSFAATWLFYDDDANPDLFIANDFGGNQFLRNMNSGDYFENITEQAGVGGFSNSLGVSSADVDNDGYAEIYVSSLYSHTGPRMLDNLNPQDYSSSNYQRATGLTRANQLWGRSSKALDSPAGETSLVDLAPSVGIDQADWSYGSAFCDLDSDGWQDLYVSNGYMSFEPDQPSGDSSLWRAMLSDPTRREFELPSLGEVDQTIGEVWISKFSEFQKQGVNLGAFQRNKLFLNVDGNQFIDASFASNADIDADSRTVIAADLDQDGAQDLIVASASRGSIRVYSNRMPQGNRMEVRLKGVTSNRPGIGSRITAKIGERTIVRDLFTQTTYGAGPATVWLGLGEAEKIDRLTVRWPTGEQQEFTDVEVNRSVLIEEGSDEIETIRKWE